MAEAVGALELFAVAAPGLEDLVAGELAELGIVGGAETGGVGWSGGIDQVYVANLHLRMASRVIVRVGSFRARSFIELERHLGRIDWSPYLGEGAPVQLRATSRKSRLYHERAIEERLARNLAERVGARIVVGSRSEPMDVDDDADAGPGPVPPPDAGPGSLADGAQLVVIRFLRDSCVVSIDSSGPLLHRRGYRQAVARAPLRETIAAAVIRASGWTGNAPLLDPFCGSGTIPIEAALLARRIPPGLATADRRPRSFAFQAWPTFDAGRWEEVLAAARMEIRDKAGVPIQASDRDEGAIAAARRNAARAGVEADIDFEVLALSRVSPPHPPGWLVSNPPYGVRVGEAARLRDLYAAFGNFARDRLPGWRIAVLVAGDALSARAGLAFEEVLQTRNGGIAVRLLRSP